MRKPLRAVAFVALMASLLPLACGQGSKQIYVCKVDRLDGEGSSEKQLAAARAAKLQSYTGSGWEVLTMTNSAILLRKSSFVEFSTMEFDVKRWPASSFSGKSADNAKLFDPAEDLAGKGWKHIGAFEEDGEVAIYVQRPMGAKEREAFKNKKK